jgi:hypothetical protein
MIDEPYYMVERQPFVDNFEVNLYHWVCPICQNHVAFRMRDEDYDSLSIEELREIISAVKGRRSDHKCPYIPIKMVERGVVYDGVYRGRRQDTE